MFRKSSIILIVVLFSACNVESGKSISTSSTTVATQANNGTTSSANTQTNGVQTGGNTGNAAGTGGTPIGTATGSNVANDQTQGSGVPTVPDFGFGF